MIPLVDLAAQRARTKGLLDAAIAWIIKERRYVLGPEVAELEQKLEAFGDAPALTCGNGPDALALPLMAWRFPTNHTVLVPSFTFASTAEVVPWLGATPIFVDIDPETYCMDPESLRRANEWAKGQPQLNPRAGRAACARPSPRPNTLGGVGGRRRRSRRPTRGKASFLLQCAELALALRALNG